MFTVEQLVSTILAATPAVTCTVVIFPADGFAKHQYQELRALYKEPQCSAQWSESRLQRVQGSEVGLMEAGVLPMPSYDSLFGAEAKPPKRGALPPEDRRAIAERLKAFAASPRVKDDALALYVNAQVRRRPHREARISVVAAAESLGYPRLHGELVATRTLRRLVSARACHPRQDPGSQAQSSP